MEDEIDFLFGMVFVAALVLLVINLATGGG